MKKETIAMVAVAMVASAACASAIVDTFESDAGGWTGDGTLTVEQTTAPAGYGYPTTAKHTQVYAVAGTATRDTSSVTSANLIDMMVKVTRPDETPDASAYASSDAQFAVYSDSDGTLRLYCKESSSGAATSVSLGSYDADAWVRLTIAVNSDGSMLVATNGVLTASKYWLANQPASAGVASVNFTGTTAIDDFVAGTGDFAPYAQVDANGNAAATDGVPVAYLAKAGKSDANALIDGSSLTVSDAYAAGVAPLAGATFAIQQAVFDGQTLTLQFPGEWPSDSYVIKYGSTTACETTATTATAAKTPHGNQIAVPLNLSAANVMYYKVVRE